MLRLSVLQSLPPMTALAGTQQARQPWVQMALPPHSLQKACGRTLAQKPLPPYCWE